MTFNHLSNVTVLNIESIDNSLALLNYMKALSFTVDRLSCGNSQLFSSISKNDKSCIKISEFSSINFTITNSLFFNKNIINNYVIDASSD